LFGIGDRHLDNILMSDEGRLFHVDFAYILGRDPKPFAPAMKICKEMVEAMGGLESEHYLKFKSYCCMAFIILRKSANLIINLFELMFDSIPPSLDNEKDSIINEVRNGVISNY
jgi:phosphatidylinositol 3-kinase